MKTHPCYLLKTLLLVGVFSLFSPPLFAQYEKLLKKSYLEKQPFFVEHFYSNNKLLNDSIGYFKEMQKVYDLGVISNDRSLINEAIFIKLNFLDHTKYSNYIPEMLHLITLVDLDKNSQLQARTRLALAAHYYEKGDCINAFKYISHSFDFLKEIEDDELPEKQEMLFTMALLHYNMGSGSKSLYFLNLANSLPQDLYSEIKLKILNTRGLIETTNKNFSVAEESFKNLLDLSNKSNDTIWKLTAMNNLATAYFFNEKYQQALDVFKDYHTIDAKKFIKPNTDILVIKSKIYQKLGQQDSFNHSVMKLISNIKNIDLNLDARQEIYPLLAQFYKNRNQLDLAYIYSDSALSSLKKNIELKKTSAILNLDIQDKMNLLQQKDLELKNNNDRIRMLWIVGLSIGCALKLIVFGIFRFVRKTERRKRIQLEFEKLKIKNELQIANEKLKISLHDLLISRGSLTVIKSQLQKIDFPEVIDSATPNDVSLLFNENHTFFQQHASGQHWSVLQASFEKAYPLFVSKIKKKFPHLTLVEKKFLILKKIGLENAEIAQIMDVNPSALRVYSHRIRKKYNFDSTDSLYEFIHEL